MVHALKSEGIVPVASAKPGFVHVTSMSSLLRFTRTRPGDVTRQVPRGLVNVQAALVADGVVMAIV